MVTTKTIGSYETIFQLKEYFGVKISFQKQKSEEILITEIPFNE